MRFPWLLSIVVGVGSCLALQGDRVVRLIMPPPQASHPTPTRLFVPEASPPPLITQGAGTR
jgi:hypothetical protein